MESRSWSLRLALALAIATAVWVGAASFSNRLVRVRIGHVAAGASTASPSR